MYPRGCIIIITRRTVIILDTFMFLHPCMCRRQFIIDIRYVDSIHTIIILLGHITLDEFAGKI